MCKSTDQLEYDNEGNLSIVRTNLMNQQGYSPYCGNNIARDAIGGCNNPRTKFNGQQFVCPNCGYVTEFPSDFIARYKAKWNK
jgi:predicted RNA-binding Zn-ribbon protein involved in translation (DUF1610 family)